MYNVGYFILGILLFILGLAIGCVSASTLVIGSAIFCFIAAIILCILGLCLIALGIGG